MWDDAVAGFGVGAFLSGKKAYVAQYRQGGRSRRITIGEHGRLTPDEARREAKKLLGSVESGDDPIARRQAERAVPTFRDVADEFMRTHVEAKRKARTLDSYETLLRRHILPAVGGLRLTDIRRSHISKMHSDLTDHPGAANRAVSVVSAIWNWTTIEEVNFAQFVVNASDLGRKDVIITSMPNSSAGVFAVVDQRFEAAPADPVSVDFQSFVKIGNPRRSLLDVRVRKLPLFLLLLVEFLKTFVQLFEKLDAAREKKSRPADDFFQQPSGGHRLTTAVQFRLFRLSSRTREHQRDARKPIGANRLVSPSAYPRVFKKIYFPHIQHVWNRLTRADFSGFRQMIIGYAIAASW